MSINKVDNTEKSKEIKKDVKEVFAKHFGGARVAWSLTWSRKENRTKGSVMFETTANCPANVVGVLYRGVLTGDPDTGGLKDE